ncbi:MAG: YajQ family cyclic di-GMP-binding protein [Proteobacteria bacterium]|nr:YajQ family cyclic di-GMP-binding protein [Pseudomonadota bacterium]
MPSFDIVSEVDLMEVENAVNQASKEIEQRFDFRGGKSSIDLDKTAKIIKIMADDDMKLRSIQQVLSGKLAKRNVDLRALKFNPEEPASGNLLRQKVDLKANLEKEEIKEVNKLIKDSKLKVTTEIQGEQLRVVSKSIDELQATMSVLKKKDFKFPIQFTNMRS